MGRVSRPTTMASCHEFSHRRHKRDHHGRAQRVLSSGVFNEARLFQHEKITRKLPLTFMSTIPEGVQREQHNWAQFWAVFRDYVVEGSLWWHRGSGNLLIP